MVLRATMLLVFMGHSLMCQIGINDFGGDVSTSYYKNGLANSKLTWERTQEFNIGLDFGFFRNRINGSLDVYQRTSKDLIMERQLPSTTGWTSVWDNIGKVRNTGLELSINTINVQTSEFFLADKYNF